MSGTLTSRIAGTFEASRLLLEPGGDRTLPLRQALDALHRQILTPMSVAVVGRISSGKSTLVNALIGEERVATGSQELTFNVNRLRHGDRPGLLVHYKDGRPPAAYELGELERLTARREEHLDELRGIAEIEVETSAPYLELFDLIDTPGLDSVYVEDSLNTLEFLQLTAEEVLATTVRHSAGADALILVVPNRGMSAVDTGVLADFLGAGFESATPLTVLGVMTKVELLWGPDGTPPMEIARGLAARTMLEVPKMRSLLYELTPVCSLVGQAAETLDDAEFAELRALSGLALLPVLLSNARRFVDDPVSGLPRDRLVRLWDRYNAYGLHLACGLLRDGVDSPADLRARLLDASGMNELRHRLVEHFGHRAELLKLDSALKRVASMPHDLAAGLGTRDRAALDQVLGLFSSLALNERGLVHLGILRDLYSGGLGTHFGHEELAEIRRILGESGRSPAELLGATGAEDRAALRRLAAERQRAWAVRWQDGTLWGPAREAAHVVLRAYEYLMHELREP